MTTRQTIVTYVPRQAFEAAAVGPVLKEMKHPPTPEQVAQFSRALQLLEETRPREGVMTTVPDELTSNLQTFLAQMATSRADPEQHVAPLDVTPSANQTLEVKFDSHDLLGWAASFFTWWQKLHKFTWVAAGAPDKIPNDVRVAILGDWGTGLYGAPECAKSIEKDGTFQFVIHLGDVYYSGTTDEVKQRFTDCWPKVAGAVNRGLNGNHEMYTGGNAYWKTISEAPFNQQASCFALENDNWLLAFLDSAYVDHDLYGDQASWLTALAAASPEKKLVLFSHHQPYSLLDRQGPLLIAKLGALLEGRVFAWYWGHEHHCIVYERHPIWGMHGRCVGHGGFPYFRETTVLGAKPPSKAEWKNLDGKNLVPGARVLDGANPYVEEHGEEYGPNGYVTLQFKGAELVEAYHMPDGEVVLRQRLK